MDLLLANHSSYPRVGESAHQQRLRRAHAQWERGQKSLEEYVACQRDVAAEVIREQVEAGMDVVTDGQVAWYDPLSHLAGKLEGVSINGLLRFFDTNFYFRQPVVEGAIRWRGPILGEEFAHARSVSPKPVKVALTGPYTLARLSILSGGLYGELAELAGAYAEALRQEVAHLAGLGASLIQLDEPAILRHPEEFQILRDAVAIVAKGKGEARLALYTYFGDAAPLAEDLLALPVDVVGFDFTYSPALADRLMALGSPKALGLGLMDGRNTRLERAEDVLPALERLLAKSGGGGGPNYLNPSCGLEYLPRDRAQEKLKNMAAIRSRLLGPPNVGGN